MRAKSFLNDINLETNKNIVIVGHEDINRILLMILQKIPESRAINISQPNNIIYKVHGDIVLNINIDNRTVNDGLMYEGA